MNSPTPNGESPSNRAAGRGAYLVQRGDSIASIAFEHGFFPNTVWNHADNAALRDLRKDPDVLLEGDRVTIPAKQERTETKAAAQRHRFRRKGVPRWLRVRFWDSNEKPLANRPVRVDVDGRSGSGSTDDEGWFKHPISPDARRATVVLDDSYTYELRLGHLSPINTVFGLQERLHDLGFYAGSIHGKDSEELQEAIRRFQSAQGLDPSGQADTATKDKLKKLVSC